MEIRKVVKKAFKIWAFLLGWIVLIFLVFYGAVKILEITPTNWFLGIPLLLVYSFIAVLLIVILFEYA